MVSKAVVIHAPVTVTTKKHTIPATPRMPWSLCQVASSCIFSPRCLVQILAASSMIESSFFWESHPSLYRWIYIGGIEKSYTAQVSFH